MQAEKKQYTHKVVLMRKGIFVFSIIMFFLSWIPGYASRQLLDPLIGKIVVVESKGKWRSTIGVFTGYDAEKIYLSRTTDKWAKKIYSKYKYQKYNPYHLPLKKGSYLLLNSEVEDILLVKDGLEPELYLELEDIDPIDLPTGKEDQIGRAHV